MTTRMSDKRLAEIMDMPFPSELIAPELLQALKADRKRITELEAKLKQVEECQRYTVDEDVYTTNNFDGEWMLVKDIQEAIK